MSTPARKILLVEDSPTDALIVKHSLRNRFEVEHVHTPTEAMPLLESQSFAAVITDYCMPGTDGLQFQQWIREKGLDIPVVIMSGHGDERVAAEAIKLGAYDYIVKSEESLSSMGVVIQQVLRRHELEQRAQVLQQIVENASDAIITLRTDGGILTTNRATTTTFGYPAEDMAGKTLATLFPGEGNETDLEHMIAAGRSGLPWQGELTARRKDGNRVPVHVSSSVLRDGQGAIRCLIAIARDVTERRQFLERLKRLSVTDNLTGLYNHRFFHDRLQYEFVRARRYGNPLGCIMIDVDFFKSVNDLHGHLIGDEALKAISGLIGQAVRSVDIVARYGGEEFAVLLPNTDLEGTLRCAQHIWETVGAADISTRQGKLRLTISAGVAALTEDVHDEEDLCRRADDALLAAKRRGRNNVCEWSELQPRDDRGEGEARNDDPTRVLSDIRRLAAPLKARYMDALRPVMESLCQRDPSIQRHAANVAQYAHEMGVAAGMSDADMAALHNASLAQAVTWIRSGGAVRTTAQPTPEQVIREMKVMEAEADMARHQSERIDGGGKPDGLAGEAIPLGARIMAIAVLYDSLVSGDAARAALTEEAAMEELRRRAGTELDPRLIELFAQTRRLPITQA